MQVPGALWKRHSSAAGKSLCATNKGHLPSFRFFIDGLPMWHLQYIQNIVNSWIDLRGHQRVFAGRCCSLVCHPAMFSDILWHFYADRWPGWSFQNTAAGAFGLRTEVLWCFMHVHHLLCTSESSELLRWKSQQCRGSVPLFHGNNGSLAKWPWQAATSQKVLLYLLEALCTRIMHAWKILGSKRFKGFLRSLGQWRAWNLYALHLQVSLKLLHPFMPFVTEVGAVWRSDFSILFCQWTFAWTMKTYENTWKKYRSKNVWRCLTPLEAVWQRLPRSASWAPLTIFTTRSETSAIITHWDHWAFQVAWLIDDQSMVGGLDGNPWVTNSHHWKWIKWMNMSHPRTCRGERGRSKGSESQLWLKAQDVGCPRCRSRRQTRMPCAEPCATQFHSQRVSAWTSWQFLTFSLQHCRLVWKVLRSDICCAQCTCRTRHSSEGGHDAITALVITCYHHEWQYTSIY